jgi:hypothetical protein
MELGKVWVKGGDVRDNFIVEPGEEEDGDFGYGGEVGIGGPDLVAEEGEVFCWWDDAVYVRIVMGGQGRTYDGISFLILKKVFSNTSPINFGSFWFLATSCMLTAPPRLCPNITMSLSLVSALLRR